MIKMLNLYAGIGGNVYKLDRSEYDITSIEYNPKIAEIYKMINPDDKIIIGDAKNYLLNNFKNYDIVWASPPCQTHGSMRNSQKGTKNHKPAYIDFSLWQLILFCEQYLSYHNINWIIENVKLWYTKLFNIPSYKIGRHFYFSNVDLNDIDIPKYNVPKHIDYAKMNWEQYIKYLDMKIPGKEYFKPINQKHYLTPLRNCVHPKEGLALTKQLTEKKTYSLEAFI